MLPRDNGNTFKCATGHHASAHNYTVKWLSTNTEPRVRLMRHSHGSVRRRRYRFNTSAKLVAIITTHRQFAFLSITTCHLEPFRPFPKWQNPPRTPPEPCKRPRPSVHAPSSAATERGAPPVRPAVPPGLPAAFPAKERNARSPVPLPGAPPRNAARRTSAAPARAIRPRPRGYRERHTAPALRSATPPHVRSPGRAQHPSEELALLPETC
jgi:hypothetical protein